MMQMLVAGGMTPLSDGERQADADNPRGYLEWERIKTLPNDPSCIAEAEGKVVKVISWLLLLLPAGHEYRVIFMERPMPEILASQDQMRRRRGTFKDGENTAKLTDEFDKHLQKVDAWLNGKPHVKTLRVAYHDVLRNPKAIGEKLADFLGVKLNFEAVSGQVDQSLYRDRR